MTSKAPRRVAGGGGSLPAPGKRKPKRKHVRKDPRPAAKGSPEGVARGTPAYREWEAYRCLELQAIGLSVREICLQLEITRAEYLERRNWLRDNLEPGDGNLAWVDFVARSRRRMQDAERALLEAFSQKHANAIVGALRLQHDIDKDLVDLGYKIGAITRPMPGGEPPAGKAADHAPPVTAERNFLVQVLAQATGGIDVRTMTDEQARLALQRFRAERDAIANAPSVPSLKAGGS